VLARNHADLRQPPLQLDRCLDVGCERLDAVGQRGVV
jgi:hypothetical protein